MTDRKQYADRDAMALDQAGNYYCRHVDAMTRERLHHKSDIAAELAWRDWRIDELEKQLQAARAAPAQDGVPLPTSKKQAQLMVRLGSMWLEYYGAAPAPLCQHAKREVRGASVYCLDCRTQLTQPAQPSLTAHDSDVVVLSTQPSYALEDEPAQPQIVDAGVTLAGFMEGAVPAQSDELQRLAKWLTEHDQLWPNMSGSPVDVAIALLSNRAAPVQPAERVRLTRWPLISGGMSEWHVCRPYELEHRDNEYAWATIERIAP